MGRPLVPKPRIFQQLRISRQRLNSLIFLHVYDTVRYALKEPENGKPLERVGRKATGLCPEGSGYGRRVARRTSTSLGLQIPPARLYGGAMLWCPALLPFPLPRDPPTGEAARLWCPIGPPGAVRLL